MEFRPCEAWRQELPLVPRAGLAGAGVSDAAHAEDKLLVLEAQAAGHAGTGVGPPVGGTHRNKAVRTVAQQTCRDRGQGSQLCPLHNPWLAGEPSQRRGLSAASKPVRRTSETRRLRALKGEAFSSGADGLTSEAVADAAVHVEDGAVTW